MNIRQHVKRNEIGSSQFNRQTLVTFESIEVDEPIENLRLGGPSSFYFDLGGKRSQDRDINEEMTLFDSNSVDRHIK